jgi:Fe-S-cluster-containing dehydrogenase component
MKPYELRINHDLCWGCRTCEVACKQENRTSDGIRLISVWEDGPRIMDGKLDVVFRIALCRHCDDPPCAEACPEEGIFKREDGIVVMDGERCSGCGSCIDACPYHAISLDSFRGVAQKCNLCHHRIDQGLVPACADNICPAHCIYFGAPDKAPWGMPKPF